MKNKSIILLLLITHFISSCAGGGSAGTGIDPGTRIIAKVLDSSSLTPINNAVVIIEETLEVTRTDIEGEFSLDINTEVSGNTINIRIISESFDIKQQVIVESESDDITTIRLNFFVDQVNNSAQVDEVQVISKIVGTCDFYFENNVPIRQSNATPSEILCTAKTTIFDSDKPVVGAPFSVRTRACEEGSPWITLAEGTTGANGSGQTEFTFNDSEETCIYQIVSPDNFRNFINVEINILTFTAQNRGIDG